MDKKRFIENIADINTDFPQWYTDVVLKTQLADYGPVKGTMVIRPYGYELWEKIQDYLNKEFKRTGHKNAYFPMLIPESFLNKEKEHVDGFKPEVAVVTYAGGAELAEKLIIRPTSETIICEMFSKWVKSYRDLPVLLNQWANVVRWEKTTRPFLRTSEFLWQEGHTLHETEREAQEEALNMLDVYKTMAEDLLAIPVIYGKKTEWEKFAGAKNTYAIEAMTHDGRSLQAGTTHELGNNFSKAANIKYLSKNETWEYPYGTSWGVSTRLIGALISVHGDERGIKLPPSIAPIQVVIIPVAANKGGVMEKVEQLKFNLESEGIRVFVDNTDNSAGWKFSEWEMKGVPLRLEIGPRDVENNSVVAVRRDNHEKTILSLYDIEKEIDNILIKIQSNMFEMAKTCRDNHITDVDNFDSFKTEIEKSNFVTAYHCGCKDCEENIKTETQATSRVIISEDDGMHKCVKCDKKAKYKLYFARQY